MARPEQPESPAAKRRAPPGQTLRPLWTCPRCGRRFANRNQWHACGDWTVADHFRDRPPELRAIFDEFLAMARRNGPVRVHAAKTRIGFIARMTFGGASPLKSRLRASLLLPKPVNLPRIERIERYGPRCFGHRFSIADASDLDAELERLVRLAYRVGMQEFIGRR